MVIVDSFIHDLFFRLDADKTKDVVESAHFHFTDIDEHLVLKVGSNLEIFIADPKTIIQCKSHLLMKSAN